MIEHLPEKKCGNTHCQQPLNNRKNTGGFKAHKTQNGWITGYTCKKCSQGIPLTTTKLALYQQTHYYPTPPNNTNKEKQHRRQWNNLLSKIHKEEKKDEAQNNAKQMPTWNQIIERTKQKRKR